MANLFRVSFHGHKQLPGLSKVTVQQKVGNHTLALLDYNISSHRDYLLPPEGTPVFVEYGTSPTGVRHLYGYVNHYETLAGEGSTYTRLVLLGTSRVMNEADPRTWSGQTRSGIARDIATKHRLRSIVHPHHEVVDSWSTGDRTDFQCLKALADEIGYRLWVDGPTLMFVDPKQIVRLASSMTTPVVRRQAQRKTQVLGGSNIPGDLVKPVKSVKYQIDFRTDEMYVVDQRVVQDPDTYVLKATLSGDARLTPSIPVEFEAGQVNTDQAGLWMITEAVHEISADSFTTRLVATRGSKSLGRVPVTPRDIQGLPRAVVRNGTTWEAALQERVHV